MDALIARQPIFDRKKNVYAYELLYREADINAYVSSDGDMASSNIILNGFLSSGLSKLTGDKKAFVNFTGNLLTQEIATLLPADNLVVEVLETVAPQKEIINACKRLKDTGYTIALDDFVFKAEYETLAKLADIIKVDFLASSDREKEFIIDRFGNGKTKFLAEKIETQQEYEKALKIGYTYFQGYFFSRPVMLSTNTIPPGSVNQFRLMKAISVPEPDFSVLADIIEMDAAFSYEVLRIVNSVYYSRGKKISSIRQALVLLGLDELRKWCYIAILRKLGGGRHDEAINFCMVRAKFLELLSQAVGMKDRKSEFITTGILSMLDVLSGCPLEKTLEETPISDEVKHILLCRDFDSILGKCFRLVLECEKGHWNNASNIAKSLNINIEAVAGMHYNAILSVSAFSHEAGA